MKEELVSFETAKLADEKEFNEWCNNLYEYAKVDIKSKEKRDCYKKGTVVLSFLNYSNSLKESGKYWYICAAPTQSLLQRWLREKHNIIVEPTYNQIYNYFELEVFELNQKSISKNKVYSSYEQALEAGLLEGLKLIK